MAKMKILIIDDEEDICVSAKSILEKTGKFEVMYSMEAIKGIDVAKRFNPDLILLDIIMPDMEGSDVAERLLQDPSTKDIPVVFLTALAKRSEVEGDLGTIGGRFFIPKPVTPAELIERIDSILKVKK